MKYNHGLEWKKFTEEQSIKAKQYKEAGMTDAAIKLMYEYDHNYFNLCRRECEHVVEAEISEQVSSHCEEENLSLCLADLVESRELFNAIHNLPENYLEIIDFLIQGYTHAEIGNIYGTTRQSITKKINKIRKILKKFL